MEIKFWTNPELLWKYTRDKREATERKRTTTRRKIYETKQNESQKLKLSDVTTNELKKAALEVHRPEGKWLKVSRLSKTDQGFTERISEWYSYTTVRLMAKYKLEDKTFRAKQMGYSGIKFQETA